MEKATMIVITLTCMFVLCVINIIKCNQIEDLNQGNSVSVWSFMAPILGFIAGALVMMINISI